MRKNGFIATSIMYSFFAVFSFVALITLSSYSHYRTLLDNVNEGIMDELNAMISDKYVTIYNLINDGGFEENSADWDYTDANRVKNANSTTSINTSYSGDYAARLNRKVASKVSQIFSIKDKVDVDSTTHKIYVSFRVFKNGTINGTNSITMNISGTDYTLDSSSLSGAYSNWNIHSQIINASVTNDTNWSISFNINNNTNNSYIFLDNIMVLDLSKVYDNSSVTDSEMLSYIDTNVDYFSGSKSVTKFGCTSNDEDASNPTNPVVPSEPVETCSAYSSGKTWTFDYTGAEQSFTPECAGNYKFEAWGAQGGSIGGYIGGYGGYTSGIINLDVSENIYIFVGESKITGGYNGGGIGYQDANYGVGGGGATDFRLSGTLWNDATSLKSRIMVAAGGGGAGNRGDGYGDGNGGSAGGLIGSTGNVINYSSTSGYAQSVLTGGTQISCGTLTGTISNTAFYGSFGSGGPLTESITSGAITKACVGGGGGYYGGSGGYHSGGGGGSSYISGYLGCVAISSSTSLTPRLDSNSSQCTESSASTDITCSYHYSGNLFTDGQMIAGNASMPTHDGTSTMVGNNGNGYAKITYLG